MFSGEFINILFPPVFVIFWVWFCLTNVSFNLRVVSLFFTSIVCFAQNFSFIFRELHQFIQVIILFFSLFLLFKRKTLPKVFYFAIVFLFFILLSLVFSPFDSDARAQTLNFFVVIGVLYFIFVSLKGNEDLDSILKYVANLSIISAISGLIELAIAGSARIESTFANPNYFALFLAVGTVLVFYQFKGLKKWLSLIVLVSAIVLSGSRAALLFPLLLMVHRAYLQTGIIRFLFYSAATTLVFAAVFASGLTRFGNTDTESSNIERLLFAGVAFNMAVDHPYTGVGWGRFISEFYNYSGTVDEVAITNSTVNITSHDRRVTHNDLLRILSELGFVCFLFVLVFVVKSLIYLIRYKDPSHQYLLPIWIGLFIFSMTHNNLNTAFSWFFFLLPWHIFYAFPSKFNSAMSQK